MCGDWGNSLWISYVSRKLAAAEAAEVQREPQLAQDSGFSPFTL